MERHDIAGRVDQSIASEADSRLPADLKTLSSSAGCVVDASDASDCSVSSSSTVTDSTVTSSSVESVRSVDLLPSAVKRRVYALKKLNLQKKAIEAHFVDELLVLHKKYEQLYEPLHQKRAEVVNGQYEPADSDLPDGHQIEVDSSQTTVAGIPNFWLKVLTRDAQMAARIETADIPILRHLRDIRVATEPAERRVSIEFHFAPNEYFSNQVLRKDIYLKIDTNETEICRPVRIVSTVIDWKEKQTEGQSEDIEEVDNNTTDDSQEEQHEERDEDEDEEGLQTSFFQFFWTSGQSREDKDETVCLEDDWDDCRDLVKELVPNAVHYFTGDLRIGYGLDDEDDDDDEDDEEEEDEEEEDQEVAYDGKAEEQQHYYGYDGYDYYNQNNNYGYNFGSDGYYDGNYNNNGYFDNNNNNGYYDEGVEGYYGEDQGVDAVEDGVPLSPQQEMQRLLELIRLDSQRNAEQEDQYSQYDHQ